MNNYKHSLFNPSNSSRVLTTNKVLFNDYCVFGSILPVTSSHGIEFHQNSVFTYSIYSKKSRSSSPIYCYQRSEEPFDTFECLDSSTNLKIKSFQSSFQFSMIEINDVSGNNFLSIYFNDDRMVVL